MKWADEMLITRWEERGALVSAKRGVGPQWKSTDVKICLINHFGGLHRAGVVERFFLKWAARAFREGR